MNKDKLIELNKLVNKVDRLSDMLSGFSKTNIKTSLGLISIYSGNSLSISDDSDFFNIYLQDIKDIINELAISMIKNKIKELREDINKFSVTKDENNED